MRFCVLSACLPGMQPLAALTIDRNMAEYCGRHGYPLLVVRRPMDCYRASRHAEGISWTRMAFALSLLETDQCDWVYVVGADVFITNMTIPLTQFADDAFHVVISGNWCCRMQADSFLVRNSPQGIGYLRFILSSFDKYKGDIWVENAAMIQSWEQFKGIIKVLPQRCLNAFIYSYHQSMIGANPRLAAKQDWSGNDGEWQPGDFALHMSAMDNSVRLKEFHRVTPMIVR